jgi:peptide/nickel transport system permease protein
VLFFLLKRFLSITATLLVASIMIFAITQLLPGDVAQMILREFATPESLAALREKLGLNEPALTRYVGWMLDAIRGNLGESLSITGARVSTLLADRVMNSLVLATVASVVVIPISILLGSIAGIRKNTWVDRIISLTSMVAISVPEFVSGVLFILFFSLTLGLLPSASNLDPGVGYLSQAGKLVLPILTLSLVLLGYIARMTRASFIDAMGSNYAKTALLKGLSDRHIITRHVLPNALIPSVTVIAMNIGWMVGGLVVVESVFAYPGIGSLLLYGIIQRDVPLIQGTALFVVAAYMLLNFIADILYIFLNPKLRYH